MRLATILTSLTFLTSTASAAPYVERRDTSTNATGIGASKIALMKALLNTIATQSWEIGTHMEALLELDYPALSVFASKSLPPPSSPIATEVLTTAASVVANKTASSLQLIPDGSSSDPASIGVSVVLANWTSSTGAVTPAQFAAAATDQIESLLSVAPRASDGAISHRMDQVQLWSDFVYMAPPFLAYYGVLTDNTTVIQASYDQCRLYRNNLRTSSGLWSHILDGSDPDPYLWATGNAWAAAGMLRVAATLLHSTYSSTYASQISDLGAWSSEIVDAAFALQPSSGLFPNYFNQSTFQDASSTALLTAVSYRLAYLEISSSTLAQAEISRQAIYSSVSASTGILSPVVDPLSYGVQGTESPEGQAFVLLMEAAWSDWYESQSGSGTSSEGSGSISSATAPVASSSSRRKAVYAGGAAAAAILCTILCP